MKILKKKKVPLTASNVTLNALYFGIKIFIPYKKYPIVRVIKSVTMTDKINRGKEFFI